MKEMIKKSLMVALVTLSSMNVLAADTNLFNSTCHVFVPNPDVYLNFFLDSSLQRKTSENTYVPEALKMFEEIRTGIKDSNLNHLLHRKLIKKGYTVHLLNSEQTTKYLSGTLEIDKISPENLGQENGLLSQLGLKKGDLFLGYQLSFGFKIQPVRNERRMTWKLFMRENLSTKNPDISVEQVNTNLFRFSSTEFKQNFSKALSKLPACDDDVVVGEESDGDSAQSKRAVDEKSSASDESKS